MACYLVYRSAKPHDLNSKPINYTRVTGTTYVDPVIEPGKYYYAVRAISASGASSDLSIELPIEVK